MGLFRKNASSPLPDPAFPAEQFEPVLRSSICTGEKTACMRDRKTGELHEIMLIRDRNELERFARRYAVAPDSIRTVY